MPKAKTRTVTITMTRAELEKLKYGVGTAIDCLSDESAVATEGDDLDRAEAYDASVESLESLAKSIRKAK